VVLLAVTLGNFFALLTEILLEGRVDDQLLTNRVASKFPCELVAVALLVVGIGGVDDFVIVLLELAVILGECLGNSRHGGYASGKELSSVAKCDTSWTRVKGSPQGRRGN
jgi:hypothetical protein